MKAWVLSLCLACLTAAAYHWRQPLRDQLLPPQPLISAEEIQIQQAKLTFRGLNLSKQEITHQLTALKLIRYHRLLDPHFKADVSAEVAAEIKSWHRQWEKDEDRQQRLTGQLKSEQDMEFSIKEALLDRAWLEQQISDEIQVSEADIQKAFTTQREHLRIPEAYRVAHLFLSGHQANKKDRSQEMAQLQQRITQGTPWDEMVKKHSEDSRSKNKGGHLGWVTTERMPKAFMDTVRQLKVGEMSSPTRTPLGWHLIRVLEKRPSRLPSLDEVRTELEATLTQQQRRAALDKLTQRLLHDHPGAAFQNNGRH